MDTGGEGTGDVVSESEDVPLPSEYVVVVETVVKFSARVLSSKYMVSTPFTNKKYINDINDWSSTILSLIESPEVVREMSLEIETNKKKYEPLNIALKLYS